MTPRSKGQRSRSQLNVTYPVKNVITQYWVVVSSSYFEANTRKTPQRVEHKMVAMASAVHGCHGNASCLATEKLNVQFKIEYFKN